MSISYCCLTNCPKTQWLKTQTCIISRFLRVRSQLGGSGSISLLRLQLLPQQERQSSEGSTEAEGPVAGLTGVAVGRGPRFFLGCLQRPQLSPPGLLSRTAHTRQLIPPDRSQQSTSRATKEYEMALQQLVEKEMLHILRHYRPRKKKTQNAHTPVYTKRETFAESAHCVA